MAAQFERNAADGHVRPAGHRSAESASEYCLGWSEHSEHSPRDKLSRSV